jgi:hypothetical protein
MEPTLTALGAFCLLLAGMFQLASMGRDSAKYRLALLLGAQMTSLAPLRGAMESKARGQVSAVLLVVGSATMIVGFIKHLEISSVLFYSILGGMAGLSFVLIVLQAGYVENAMRRYLLAHLRQFPFSFEDNLALTREIGELFGVESGHEDTLESYVRKLRERLGLKQPQSKLFGRRNPHARA